MKVELTPKGLLRYTRYIEYASPFGSPDYLQWNTDLLVLRWMCQNCKGKERYVGKRECNFKIDQVLELMQLTSKSTGVRHCGQWKVVDPAAIREELLKGILIHQTKQS